MRSEKYYFVLVLMVVAFTFIFFATNANNTSAPTSTIMKYASDMAISGKKLVFDDEFSGTALNSKNWSTCYDWRKPTETGCTNQGNLEQQWYIPDQVKLNAGNLVITATKHPTDVALQNQVKTFDYTSGMINSGRGSTAGSIKWAGTYGYFEAKMKFQNGQGVWPAFWLLPIDKDWPPEIDVMEFIGSKPKEILQTVHWQNNGTPQKSEVVIKANTEYSNGWHTYGVNWQASRIGWYIDGKLTRSYTGSNVPNTPMEIILNLAIGGILPGNAGSTTTFPNTLSVDYVRVYQSVDQVRSRSY